MKRRLSHYLFPLACLCLLPFCLQPGTAFGVEKNHGKAAGHFHLQLDGKDSGWVQSVEGGGASSDTVQEKLGPVPGNNTGVAKPITNLQPRPQLAPPACPNPPCGLGNTRPKPYKPAGLGHKKENLNDKKDSLTDMNEQAELPLQQEMDKKGQDGSSNTIDN